MRKSGKKFNSAKKIKIVLIGVFISLAVGFLLNPTPLLAQDEGLSIRGVWNTLEDWDSSLRSSLIRNIPGVGAIINLPQLFVSTGISLIVGLEGFVIWILTKILIIVASYNKFTNSLPVQIGWVLVRDIANLFFVVILLIIALATILRLESYNFKRLLPKLLLMAALVNFSLVITGLMIDFAQVIMLTFVNSFATSSGGPIVIIQSFRIKEIISAIVAGEEEIELWKLLITGILMVIMLAIVVMVLIVMVVVFVIRIVMLWVLVILSPLAFMLAAFPQGQRYSQQWWQEFSKYVIIGPVLGFFLWLSFAVLAGTNTSRLVERDFQGLAEAQYDMPQIIEEGKTIGSGKNEVELPIITEIIGVDKMFSFIIAIAMLMASLALTRQAGVMGAGFAGRMFEKMRAAGAAPVFAAWTGAKTLGKAPFQYAARKINEGIGEGKIKPWVNPAAMYRGWVERRKELYESAKAQATAGGKETWEKIFVGAAMPHRQMLTAAEESKFAKDFSWRDKEDLAQQAVELRDAGGSEGRTKRRALIKAAGEKGYLDDLMAHPEMKKWVRSSLEEKYQEADKERKKADNDPTKDKKLAKFADYVDDRNLRGRMDAGEFHGYNQLHLFLENYIGDHQEGLTTINNLEEVAARVRHPEYAGHATYRSKAEGGNNEMEMESLYETSYDTGKVDEKGNKIEGTRKSAQRRGVVEFSKWPGRNKMSVAPQGAFTLYSDGRAGIDDFGEQIIAAAFAGQEQRVVEHSQNRMWPLSLGGTADEVDWKKDKAGNYALDEKFKDKIAVIDAPEIKDPEIRKKVIENRAKALASMYHKVGDKGRKAIWQKVGGKEGNQGTFEINGKSYSAEKLLEKYPELELEEELSSYDERKRTRRAGKTGTSVTPPGERREAELSPQRAGEIIEGTQDSVNQAGQDLGRAFNTGNTEEITSALTDLENALNSCSSEIEKLARTPQAQNQLNNLDDLISKIGQHRDTEGRDLDSGLIANLISNTNKNLAILSKAIKGNVRQAPITPPVEKGGEEKKGKDEKEEEED